MTKCEILTFQFAHNYGALLQCFALKESISELNIKVSVSTFTPDQVKQLYSLYPNCSLRHPKRFIESCCRSLVRWKQYGIFENFIKDLIAQNDSTKNDYVIIGSDQVWNENITGEIDTYYGSKYSDAIKVSYAGSFGSEILTDFQKSMVAKFFPEFKKISLRESSNASEVEKLCGKEVECVVDPVFLLENKKWHNFGHKPNSINKESKFVFFYALRKDDDLVKAAFDYARQHHCVVFSAHPTCNFSEKNFINLNDVGPREFIYLIENSEMVVTNSFHAMSFASIFKKKAIYKAYSNTESRIPDLLSHFDVVCDKLSVTTYDFSTFCYDKINAEIIKSKSFLKQAIEKRSIAV